MRISVIVLTLGASLGVSSCSNFEDADPSSRSTFIKVYEGAYGYTAASMEVIPGGYIILGNTLNENGRGQMVIIRTDLTGNRVDTQFVGEDDVKDQDDPADDEDRLSVTGASIKPIISNGTNVTGYVVVGNSIKTNVSPENPNDFEVVSATITFLNADLEVVETIVRKDEINIGGKTDFRATGVTISATGKIVVLGTYHQSELLPVKPFIFVMEPNGATYKFGWYKQFDLIDKDYQNAKSVIYDNGKIVWASAVAQEQQDFNLSYVSVPFVEEGTVFSNYSLLGESTEQLFQPSDICMSAIPGQGYGVIGTFGNTGKLNKNIFFLRVDGAGNIIEGSERFFDAAASGFIVNDRTTSSAEDTGDALTATSEGGFVLAGSTIFEGNVSREIMLVKVDPSGSPVWAKTLGGNGDETVSAVRESTNDAGLLILGTSDIGGFPSIYLIKTDSNGELKK